MQEALNRGVLEPTSAIFHDPLSQVAFSIDKAIAHALLDDAGRYEHFRTKQSMTLQVRTRQGKTRCRVAAKQSARSDLWNKFHSHNTNRGAQCIKDPV